MMKKIVTLFLAVVLMTTMALSAFAAEFTPSVEAKPAPEVVAQTGADGKEYAAVIRGADGKEIACVPVGDLIITPVSEADKAPAEIKERLESADQQLKSVNSLTELSDQLEKAVKEISADMTVNDLVVRDLFDVSVTGTYAVKLQEEGGSLSVRFALSADAELLAAVLYNVKGTTWETVPNNRITRNKDRTVDVVLDSLGPVAFLFDAGKLNVDPNAPDSPQTGEPDFNASGRIAAGIAFVFAAAAFVAAKKRTSRKA